MYSSKTAPRDSLAHTKIMHIEPEDRWDKYMVNHL